MLLFLLQEKHVETAKLLLGEGKELNGFVARLLDDIANLKAMLHAISIGKKSCIFRCFVKKAARSLTSGDGCFRRSLSLLHLFVGSQPNDGKSQVTCNSFVNCFQSVAVKSQ